MSADHKQRADASAIALALQILREDRQALLHCHQHPESGAVDADAQFALDRYDLAIAGLAAIEAPTAPLPAAEEVDPWRPIETAPKDGTEIILGRAEGEEAAAVSTPGYWQEGYEDGVDYMGCDSGFVDSHHQVFAGGRSFGSEKYRYAPNQPTHWMPLPSAPTTLPPGEPKP